MTRGTYDLATERATTDLDVEGRALPAGNDELPELAEPLATYGDAAADPTGPRIVAGIDGWHEELAIRSEGLDSGDLAELDRDYGPGNGEEIPGGTPLPSPGTGAAPTCLDPRRYLNISAAAPRWIGRYRLAAQRVGDAMDVATKTLTEQLRAADAGAWSAAGLARWHAKQEKLGMHLGRKERLVNCCTGAVGVQMFACRRGCAGEQRGAVMGCNVRVCPRCAPKLRRKNQAYVLSIMEAVDELRRRTRRPPARWRFVTLTIRSGPDFVAMRRAMGRYWGKLLRRRVWTDNVSACVAFFETTHTAAGWHVHLHALVDGFVPRWELVKAWEQITHGAGQPQGQHVSLPKGNRKAIARELAKYAAKDLGGACSDDPEDPWGVAGTPERLAEFYLGAIRWRTLRTYGDAFNAGAMIEDAKITASMLCECCGQAEMEYTRTCWVRSLDLVAAGRGSRPPP